MSRTKMMVHKLRHSHDVARHCRELALVRCKNEEFADVAELMGYCHDVGALDEIARTGEWMHVEDHGVNGCHILLSYAPSSYLSNEYKSMFRAISQHNKPTLADWDNEFLKILRDADKLAIFEYVCGLIDDGRLQEFCDDFFKCAVMPMTLCSGMLDWLNDINYRWTWNRLMDFNPEKDSLILKVARVAEVQDAYSRLIKPFRWEVG